MVAKILFGLIVLISCALAQENNSSEKDLQSVTINDLVSFNKWKFENKRSYFNAEEANYRMILFLKNLQKVNKHNSKQNRTYDIGVNQFTDLTQQEFAAIALNPSFQNEIPDQRNLQSGGNNNTNPIDPLKEVPQSVDWRISGKVSPVKNQGGCGSCWAFAVTGLLESVNLLRNNTLSQYSEQELVDCTLHSSGSGYRNFGCNGGWPNEAHRYIQKNGISSQKSYPYKGKDGNCTANSNTTKEFYAGLPVIPSSNNPNRTNLIQFSVSKQPLSVLVDASKWGSYRSGVFNNCGLAINHAVLLVGYTAEGNWIIKNSWGTRWGQFGYMILARGNTCAVESNILGSTI